MENQSSFYHLIIMDASGSMDCIRRAAVSGCNETIQNIRSLQRKIAEQKHYLSLVVFNSDYNPIHTIYDCQPIDEVREMQERDFVPDACTPLYDAVGLSIAGLQSKISGEANKAVMVTIITDGLENSSSVYNEKKVRSLVEELKQCGWTFAFIGANQDEVLEARKMGIENALAFEQDERGTKELFRRQGRAAARVSKYAAECCGMAVPMPSMSDIFAEE